METKPFSKSWKNRENDLAKVKRYNKFDVMFYRTDLKTHSERCEAWLYKSIPFVSYYYPNFKVVLAQLISKFHDDYELVLKDGDVSFQLKLLMNTEQHNDLVQREILAAEKISKYYPKKIKGYKYLDFLFHAIHKDCPEAQLHSFVDKLDAYCEAIHEVLAGNVVFIEPMINYHTNVFGNLQGKFPLIKDLFGPKSEYIFNFPVVDLKDFFKKGNIGTCPHTRESIIRKTLIPHYEEWKRITLETFPNGMDLLTKQLEFHEK